MGRIVVQYPGFRGVRVNGEVKGETNSVIRLDPGHYLIMLEGEEDYTPEHHEIEVTEETEDRPWYVSFNVASPRINRFSPLYCRYNGLLLGQFMMLMHARYAENLYDVRRARLQEFLKEIDVDCEVPEKPLGVFTDGGR